MTTDIVQDDTASFSFVPHDKIVRALDLGLIYGTIILIPFDLPLIHQACVPLAAVAVLLMLLRGDAAPFLAYMRQLPVCATLAIATCALAIASLYGNVTIILGAAFQGQSGWVRGTAQALLLFVAMLYPFYLSFCLRRHPDWKAVIIKAAWWSLPIPLLVGALQLANVFGVHGLARLPYVGGNHEEGDFFRLTSVARESSWFASFACVILPFLIMSLPRSSWRRWAGLATIGVLLLFVVFGTSKSAFAAMAIEFGIGIAALVIVFRPVRLVGKIFFALFLLVTTLFTTFVITPSFFTRVTQPFVNKAEMVYVIFLPLLEGNTKFVSIGTRFGMSSAGISMGEDYPVAGVGLGQFGFNAYNYTPLWGLNSETLGWLSNDTKGWPSTSNVYTRLLGEMGAPGAAVYVALRLALMLGVGWRLLRKDSDTWFRDLGIVAIMAALVAFDFHRDSFVNLDLWAAMGMALAAMHETVMARRGARKTDTAPGRWMWPLFGTITAVSFCVTLCVVLAQPVSYQASTTVLPKTGGITVSASQSLDESGTSITPAGDTDLRFKMLHMFWASSTVGARIIAAYPDMARAVLGPGEAITPAAMADYIKWNVIVLMEDKQTTLTFQYRNPDPRLAQRFLAVTLDQTDRAIKAVLAARGAQAAQLAQLVTAKNMDIPASQSVLAQSAARELQSGFDSAGESTSFDYIERPAVSLAAVSPQPIIALLFVFLLALMTAMLLAFARLLWPLSPRAMAAAR